MEHWAKFNEHQFSGEGQVGLEPLPKRDDWEPSSEMFEQVRKRLKKYKST